MSPSSQPEGAPARPGRGSRRAAHAPGELGLRAWGGALRRTVSEFRADNLTDVAAALTYNGVLAIFPALIAACRSSA